MKLTNRFLFIALFAVLSFCKVSESVHYKAYPLDELEILSMEKNSISFNYLVFNKRDCKKFLGRSKMLRRGYQPVQISFTNNTNKHLMLSPSSFSFRCVNAYEVAHRLHYNTTSRILGWTVGGLFIWPFIIPAIVECFESPDANNQMDMDYSCKALVNCTVSPFETISGLIYVPCGSFRSNFSFSVIDPSKNEQITLSTINPIVNLNCPHVCLK